MSKRNKSSILSHVMSVLFFPFNVTVVIPTLLLNIFKNKEVEKTALTNQNVIIVIGIILMFFGLLLVIMTIKQFALKGGGTLAPWNPPKNWS